GYRRRADSRLCCRAASLPEAGLCCGRKRRAPRSLWRRDFSDKKIISEEDGLDRVRTTCGRGRVVNSSVSVASRFGNYLPQAAARFTILSMNYQNIITIEPGKRGGKPCIRGMRITVYDVLEYLASGMSQQEVLEDFPYLTEEDIRACLAYAADREKRLMVIEG